VMGVTGGIGGGTGEVWPFIAGEGRDTPKEQSVDRPSLSEGAQARL
jgi:hypothetical protein